MKEDAKKNIVFLQSDAAATIYFAAHFVRLRRLFLNWKARRHQRRLDKVRTSETVTVARRCHYYAQPLNPAVSWGNDSYNSPSASVVTVIQWRSHAGVRWGTCPSN